MNKLRGTFTVMVTPFTPDEQLDEKGFRENIDWYIDEGIHGVICLGSTGEFANLAYDDLFPTLDGQSDLIPVEADGGPGTAYGHWDEATFGNELMTGYINGGKIHCNPSHDRGLFSPDNYMAVIGQAPGQTICITH